MINSIPAASGTVATLINGNKLSVIGWDFSEEHDEWCALTIRGPLRLRRGDTILEIKHADGRTEIL